MSDTDDSTPAVWDPAARGGAGGWVRRPRPGQGGGPEPTVAAVAGQADEDPTALLPRVPEQQPEQQPETQPNTALVRPYLPHPAAVPDPAPARELDPTKDLDGRPLFRPSPGHGAEREQTAREQTAQEQTQPLYPGAVPPPPPGYPPAGDARPPYTRPSPGRPVGAEPLPPVPAPAPERRRVSPALLLLIVVLAAAIVGVVGVLVLGGPAKHPAAQDSTPPVSPTAAAPAPPAGASTAASTTPSGGGDSTSPSATASSSNGVGTGDGKSEATAVDQLLAESSSSRQQVVDAVAQVSQCNDSASVAAAQTTLNQAAASRQSLVTRLDALNVSQVPGGAQAVRILSRAWTESATADTDYALWAGAMTGNGCTPNNAPQNADYGNAVTQSGLATTDKNTFIDQWTPIAMQYGLPTRTADAI